MKFIKKQGAPAQYLSWCKKVAGTADEHYNSLRDPEKSLLRDSLLKEQGFLCAYTMRRITKSSSHIEHIKPESKCRKDEKKGSDLDYQNMVACFPRDGMKNPYRYGAPAKDNWWENDGKEFISPLHETCEKRFRFDIKGNIMPSDNHPSAQKTIDVLKLNHPSLIEDRKNAIIEFIYGHQKKSPLSPKQIKKAKAEIYALSNRGELKSFCVAIYHALNDYEQQLKRISKKIKFQKNHMKNYKKK